MKRRSRCVVAAAFAVGLALAGIASRAGATATTHIWGPSADLQPYKKLHLTYDVYLPVERSAAGVRLPSVTNLGLTMGVLPFRRLNLELGFDHKTGYGKLDSYPLYFNGKIGVSEDAAFRYCPALAAGILDVGTKTDATDANVVYAKVARTFGRLGRASLGYFEGNRKLLLDSKGKKDNQGVMAAWERSVPELSDRLWLCVEYMGTKSTYGTLNLGGSWRFAPNMTVLAGYDVMNDGDLAPNTFTLQADVDFDLGSGQ